MGLLSNRVERSEIRPGDHIYTWRAVYAYSHHGTLLNPLLRRRQAFLSSRALVAKVPPSAAPVRRSESLSAQVKVSCSPEFCLALPQFGFVVRECRCASRLRLN